MTPPEIIAAIAALTPYVNLHNNQRERYIARGGDPDALPDSHPGYTVEAEDIRVGAWRAAASALARLKQWAERQEIAQAGTAAPPAENSVIPCHRGSNCSWPACAMDCDGRPGRPVTAPDTSADRQPEASAAADLVRAFNKIDGDTLNRKAREIIVKSASGADAVARAVVLKYEDEIIGNVASHRDQLHAAIAAAIEQAVSEAEKREREWFEEKLQERLDEINAEAEAFEKDSIKALRWLLLNECGDAGHELVNDVDGWSTDQAIECIREVIRARAKPDERG